MILDTRGYLAEGEPVWRDPALAEQLNPIPMVRMKFVRQDTPGIQAFPKYGNEVVKKLYGEVSVPNPESLPLYGAGTAYEQWVTLETQGVPLSWEPVEDKAYAFHRCLLMLNEFLASYILAFGEPSTQLISTADLGSVVHRGAYDPKGTWHNLAVILMHPDEMPTFLPMKDMDQESRKFEAATATVAGGQPFVPAKLWYWRAKAAARRGDQVDRVIALQTSMESLLFATWRMILVDQGLAAAEIESQVESDTPFKSLVTKILPQLLGGRWDVTLPNTVVGGYWKSLYLLRNHIVHGARTPSVIEGDHALAAYKAMRTYVNKRVWAKRKAYPRTVLTRIGQPSLFGWKDPKFDAWVKSIAAEGYTHWLPYDYRPKT